jgi:hypothetical protein
LKAEAALVVWYVVVAAAVVVVVDWLIVVVVIVVVVVFVVIVDSLRVSVLCLRESMGLYYRIVSQGEVLGGVIENVVSNCEIGIDLGVIELVFLRFVVGPIGQVGWQVWIGRRIGMWVRGWVGGRIGGRVCGWVGWRSGGSVVVEPGVVVAIVYGGPWVLNGRKHFHLASGSTQVVSPMLEVLKRGTSSLSVLPKVHFGYDVAQTMIVVEGYRCGAPH